MRLSQKSYRLLRIAIFLIIGIICTCLAIRDASLNDEFIPIESPEIQVIIDSAMEQTRTTVSYDPAYVRLPYPNGDVPSDTGVCSDVIIRAFRKANIDLQVMVHEDMNNHFSMYPHKWGLSKPDPNIDHRRVPNLMTYFKRHGKSVGITQNPADYRPGDIVAWDFGAGKTHIGLVSNKLNKETDCFIIIHNAGIGTRLEDRLFEWPIIGHYRYFR